MGGGRGRKRGIVDNHIVIKIPNNAHHLLLYQGRHSSATIAHCEVKLSKFGSSSVYCSSCTGPGSLDSPMHRICITKNAHTQAFPRLSEIAMGNQEVFFAQFNVLK